MARPALKNFRRIVVKVGSSLLIDSDAGEVRTTWLSALAGDLARLHGEGRELLVVSSGSIALGRSRNLRRDTIRKDKVTRAPVLRQPEEPLGFLLGKYRSDRQTNKKRDDREAHA